MRIQTKEPKPAMGKTKVVSGTSTADLDNGGLVSSVMSLSRLCHLCLHSPRVKQAAEGWDVTVTTTEFPWPLAVVAVLGLGILCQHGQGRQGGRCCLGEGPGWRVCSHLLDI